MRGSLGRHCWLAVWAGLLCLLTPSLGRTEGESMPLAELRAAAEALADVEPELVLPRRHEGQLGTTTREPAAAALDGTRDSPKDKPHDKSFHSELKEAIHGAVRAEIAREAMGRPTLSQSVAHAKGAAKPSESSDSGRGEAGSSGKAALQAQQARQNQAISQAKKAGKGESLMTGKQMTPPSKDFTGKPQAVR